MLPDITRHIPALRRYALVLTRDPGQVEDLVQESLARALAGSRSWRPGSDLRAWLLSITHNTFVSGWRREQVARTGLELVADTLPPSSQPVLPDLRVEAKQVVERLLSLPDGMREILLLAVVEEMSYREIADMLNIPMGTVMSRLARARVALRSQMEGGPATPEERRAAFKLVE
ncbi:sigma-70 family RNA polymerase sigma factor [Niveispirillum sp. KHB5.9]|uniref:sigma-70 family RNA polymerase sigma factor n=1 Tax=Niveispirillum sp. KHB5.9 TaxID=3400269 RepID=UPI003A8C1A18